MKNRSVRLTALILLLVLALTACAAPATAPQTEAPAEPQTEAQTDPFSYIPDRVRSKDSIRLLMFGNSYTSNISTYVWDILRELGYKDITIGRMWISGASLQTHADNIKNGTAAYDFCLNTDGSWKSQGMHDAAFGAAYTDWDFITLQHQSAKSALSASFEPALTELVDFFTEKAPDSKLVWYMTWAYSEDYIQSKESFKSEFESQAGMYGKLLDALSVVEAHPEFVTVLPVGTAVQNLRTAVGDTVNKDGSHLALGMARYAATMAYVKGLTGQSIDDLQGTAVDDCASRRNQLCLQAGKLAVNAAFEHPRAVTPITVE